MRELLYRAGKGRKAAVEAGSSRRPTRKKDDQQSWRQALPRPRPSHDAREDAINVPGAASVEVQALGWANASCRRRWKRHREARAKWAGDVMIHRPSVRLTNIAVRPTQAGKSSGTSLAPRPGPQVLKLPKLPIPLARPQAVREQCPQQRQRTRRREKYRETVAALLSEVKPQSHNVAEGEKHGESLAPSRSLGAKERRREPRREGQRRGTRTRTIRPRASLGSGRRPHGRDHCCCWRRRWDRRLVRTPAGLASNQEPS